MSFKPHSIISTTRIGGVNISAGRQVPISTTYLHNAFSTRATEIEWQTAGTFRRLKVFVSASNTTVTPATVTARVNGIASALSVTIPAGTLGEFTDLTNEMTIVPGDALDYDLQRGGSGTQSFTPERIDVEFYTGGRVLQKFSNAPYTAFTFNNTTRYQAIAFENNSTGTLADNTRGMRTELNTSTWKNLSVEVFSNSRINPFVLQFRKNTAAVGNGIVTVPALTTGIFTDLTNVDNIAVINPMYQMSGGAGIQSIQFCASIECESTLYHWTGFSLDPTNFSFNGTRYQRIISGSSTVTTTETDSRFQTEMDSDGVITGLDAFFTNNAKTGATTITLRINSVDTALSVTIPAGSPNLHSNFTNVVQYKKGDKLNWKIVTTSTGNLNCRWLTLTFRQNSGKLTNIAVM